MTKEEYTSKEMFEVVKYFKNLYTLINNRIVERIYFDGNRFYYKQDQYFILYGELINTGDNEFLNWVLDKQFTLDLEYINTFKNSVVKKNIIDLTADDNEFKMTYTDRDGENQSFVCSNEHNPKYDPIIKKAKEIDASVKHKYVVNLNDFEETLVLYVGENDAVTRTITSEKIVEFPIKRILSVQSLSKVAKKAIGVDDSDEGVTYSVEYSDRDEYSKRYVQINSTSGYVKLSQIFATI